MLPKKNKIYQSYSISTALSSTTQHAMPPKFGRKWETECLNTRFPLPTLLGAGYSVKLIYLFLFICSISSVQVKLFLYLHTLLA